jgi:[ribosomal protein S18]-alanine N-acetyltransferase
MKPTITVHIRWLIRRDLPEVVDIEKQCFEYPWSKEDFLNCLRQRNCIGMVAEYEDRVIGFMVYELSKKSIHISDFAVACKYQLKGIGRQMVDKLKAKLSLQRRNKLLLEIRESNVDAQLFFKHVGFKATNILRDFYEETNEDAYLFQYRYRQDISSDIPIPDADEEDQEIESASPMPKN